MFEHHNDDNKNISNEKNYQFDEERMINEGLAGGTVNLEYKEPSIDEAISLKEEEKPRDPKEKDSSDSEKKDHDLEIDKMIDEGMAGGHVNDRQGKKQIEEESPLDKPKH